MSDRLNTTTKKRQNSDSTFKVNSFQSRGFGLQQKVEESEPATKAELWESYQQAKQLNQKGTSSSPTQIQAKLTIGQPGDKYEQEADSVADRVMAMPEPKLSTSTVPNSVQTRSIQPIQKVSTDTQEDTTEESKQEGSEEQIQAKESVSQTRETTTTSAKVAEIPNEPSIQRDDANGSKTTQPATANWVAPFDLGVITNSADASVALVDIKNKLTEWKEIGYEGEMSLVFNMVERELKASYGVSHPLTREEANGLTTVGLFANQAYQNALKNLQQAISAELDKFTGIEAQNSVDDVAEQLHQAFMDTEGESKIADIRAAFDKSKELSGKVSKYVGYASKAKTIVKSAAKLDDIKKSIEGFKSNMSQASELAGLAQEVFTLAGKVSQKPGGTQNDIAQLKSAFKLVDFAISKSSVPIIGQWWDGYIKPCAEIALKKLAELDRMADKSVRLNELRLEEWWSASGSGAKAPLITDSGLHGLALATYFRGGQQMLDFMWSLFRGKGAESVPADIEDTFIKYRAQFNTGQEETNQIETDVHWYDPTSWVGRTKSPNLASWVNKNKETVWAMLYGKLPHP